AGVFIEGIAVLDPRLRAIVIVSHLEVHDTSHRVRTVSGGGAVFKNFDALDSGLGNRIQIHEHHIHQAGIVIDRKSTRLNSSHDQISYAVFCLKKKKKKNKNRKSD